MFNLPRLATMALVAASLSGCGALSTFEGFLSPTGELAAQKPGMAMGKAYVFRGMGGRFASDEMDHLSEKIRSSGVVEVRDIQPPELVRAGRRGDRPLQENPPADQRPWGTRLAAMPRSVLRGELKSAGTCR